VANPTVTIETNHGTITAEMYLDRAPKTAGNFIDLARKGYYDGLVFHRVIERGIVEPGERGERSSRANGSRDTAIPNARTPAPGATR